MKVRFLAFFVLTGTSQLCAASDIEGYLGVGGGTSMATFSSSTSSSGNSKAALAFRAIGGVAFNKHLAIEAEYVDLGAFHDVSYALTDMKNTATSIALKGAITFPKGFSFYGKIGSASVSTNYTVRPGWTVSIPVTQTKKGTSFGWGGEWEYSTHGTLRVSFDNYEVGTQGITGRVGVFGVAAIGRF